MNKTIRRYRHTPVKSCVEQNRSYQHLHVKNNESQQDMQKALNDFLEWMRVKNYSVHTVLRREELLCHFLDWLAEKGVHHFEGIDELILEAYQKSLYYRVNSKGQRLGFQSQNKYISVVKAWFKWLVAHRYLACNPTSDLELAKESKRLPKSILSEVEVERVLSQPDTSQLMGIRDKAILETFYSTGMRRTELAHLKQNDFDFERATVVVREGKGRRDRMLPISKRALMWIRLYIETVRPALNPDNKVSVIFLNQFGEPFGLAALTALCRKYIIKAGVEKEGACHIFRHSMATLMLENGADIRFIQVMLGHARLETTQIYTQVSIKKLKEVHALTHPANRSISISQ